MQRSHLKPAGGLASAALTLALIGMCLPIGIPSILAVCLGHAALHQPERGTAIAALILGYLMIGLIAFGVILNVTGAV